MEQPCIIMARIDGAKTNSDYLINEDGDRNRCKLNKNIRRAGGSLTCQTLTLNNGYNEP